MTGPTDPHAAPPPYGPRPDQPPYQPPPYQPPPAYQPPPGYQAPPAFGAQPGTEPSAQYPAAGPGWQSPYPPQWPPPQPSHARRNVLIAVAVVVVLAAAGIGSYFAFRGSGSSNRLSLPSSFAGFSQENDATATRVERAIRGFGSGAGGEEKRIFDASTIAVYQKDSDVTTRLIAFALPASKVPRDQGGTPSQVTQGLLAFMGANVPERPAGSHGGSSRCGATSVGAASETACAWSDSSTTGMLVSVGTPLSPGELGSVELALRDQVD